MAYELHYFQCAGEKTSKLRSACGNISHLHEFAFRTGNGPSGWCPIRGHFGLALSLNAATHYGLSYISLSSRNRRRVGSVRNLAPGPASSSPCPNAFVSRFALLRVPSLDEVWPDLCR